MVTLELTESNKAIERKILKAIADEANRRVIKNANSVEKDIRNFIPQWIMEQPEIQSLLGQGIPGSLASQFGLRPGDSGRAIDSIIDAVVNSVRTKVQKFSPDLRGGVDFEIQPIDFSNLLVLPEGYVPYKDGSLHWLDWLLVRGDDVIVIGYEYVPSGDGRSGGGTMKEGTFWRVPPQYSGTTRNNFITRALSGREQTLTPILQRLLD